MKAKFNKCIAAALLIVIVQVMILGNVFAMGNSSVTMQAEALIKGDATELYLSITTQNKNEKLSCMLNKVDVKIYDTDGKHVDNLSFSNVPLKDGLAVINMNKLEEGWSLGIHAKVKMPETNHMANLFAQASVKLQVEKILMEYSSLYRHMSGISKSEFSLSEGDTPYQYFWTEGEEEFFSTTLTKNVSFIPTGKVKLVLSTENGIVQDVSSDIKDFSVSEIDGVTRYLKYIPESETYLVIDTNLTENASKIYFSRSTIHNSNYQLFDGNYTTYPTDKGLGYMAAKQYVKVDIDVAAEDGKHYGGVNMINLVSFEDDLDNWNYNETGNVWEHLYGDRACVSGDGTGLCY